MILSTFCHSTPPPSYLFSSLTESRASCHVSSVCDCLRRLWPRLRARDSQAVQRLQPQVMLSTPPPLYPSFAYSLPPTIPSSIPSPLVCLVWFPTRGRSALPLGGRCLLGNFSFCCQRATGFHQQRLWCTIDNLKLQPIETMGRKHNVTDWLSSEAVTLL